ncbi:MAG: hypothetical protein M3R70_05195 [Actinomycetota bacterium]|nr:hypothetical protein [Actinomycetota bacterium]
MSKFLKGAVAGGIGAAMVLAASAAIAGTGIGGIFNLGVTNTVDGHTLLVGKTKDTHLQVRNDDTGPTAGAFAGVNTSPFPTVRGINRGTGAGGSFTSASATNAALLGANSGNGNGVGGSSKGGNGVQGISNSFGASGVYGQNDSTGGYGVAGRAGSNGNAIFGDNTGTGFAGYFQDKVFLGGDLVCGGCVGASDIAGKVNDSDKLDGIDSTGFVQGGGKATGQAIAEAPGVHLFLGPPMGGFLRLSYACPATLANNGTFKIYNDSGSDANVFVESGAANPNYYALAPGGQINLPAAPAGDSWHIQAQGALGVLTIEAASVHRASDCHAQAQALLTN